MKLGLAPFILALGILAAPLSNGAGFIASYAQPGGNITEKAKAFVWEQLA